MIVKANASWIPSLPLSFLSLVMILDTAMRKKNVVICEPLEGAYALDGLVRYFGIVWQQSCHSSQNDQKV